MQAQALAALTQRSIRAVSALVVARNWSIPLGMVTAGRSRGTARKEDLRRINQGATA